MNNKIIMWKGVLLGAIVMGILSFGFYQNQSLVAQPVEGKAIETLDKKSEALNSYEEDEDVQQGNSYQFAAAKATPAVVTVYASTIVKGRSDSPQDFFDFFRDRRFDKRRSEPKEYKQQSSGSGVIISKDGYIVTNNHVVKDVDELQVQLSDKRVYDAKVIGTDPLTDIALIKIEAEDLSFIKLGNSDQLKLGQAVVAIGNPLRIGITVTTGIVSALKRNIGIIEDSYSVESFIQTDAVINRGNSGGALVNLKGELIGINSAIYSGTGYYNGYGFSVPVNIVKHVISEIKKEGKVRRGYIGISLSEVDYKIAKAKGWKAPKGVYVRQLIPDMPAEEAGIEQDDIILAVDAIPVNAPNELQVQVSSKPYNAKVTLKIFREGKTLNKTVQLKERSESNKILASNKLSVESLGLGVKRVSSELKRDLDIDYGLEITDVRQFSEAYEARLKEGDVILKAGKTKLYSANDLKEYIAERSKGDVIRLYVKPRDSKYKTVIYLELK